VGAASLEDYDKAAACVTSHDGCAVCVWLRVLQPAADNPNIRYHHRGNADHNQVFHFVISLF
jgi:hypothetical protein